MPAIEEIVTLITLKVYGEFDASLDQRIDMAKSDLKRGLCDLVDYEGFHEDEDTDPLRFQINSLEIQLSILQDRTCRLENKAVI